MAQRKDKTVRTLVLSIISLVIGIVWTMASTTVITAYSDIPLWRIAILFGLSILFLGPGIWGLFKWRAMRKTGGEKVGKAVPIITGIVVVLSIFQLCVILPPMWKRGILNTELKGYVRDEFSDENVKMPGEPWFVFYHDGFFEVPSGAYARSTDNPSKVNVVVMYEDSKETIGTWVVEGSRKEVGPAMEQTSKVYVIRLEDWALIDEKSFSVLIRDIKNNWINITGTDDVKQYINDLVK